MTTRREMFLAKNPIIKRFTKNAAVKNFHVSETEFDELIQSGFMEENNQDICVNCHRAWDQEQETCAYCGEEEYTKEKGYYRFT